MKNRYIILIRDWKGSYYTEDACGYILVGGEDQIETGGDYFAMVFAQKPTIMSAQQIYDINNRLNDEDVDGFTWSRNEKGYIEDNVVIEV